MHQNSVKIKKKKFVNKRNRTKIKNIGYLSKAETDPLLNEEIIKNSQDSFNNWRDFVW
ncbi:hypothetical protein [Spiroplasma endosymbiont of Amphibalanus improvisus]|uniref:hypothetical protein n=1 Tax=Spiroplasma endosymbiont of Amphibalanus improvisus TaxID=3066327 RepID=UPI00313BADFC